ncbi:MAG: YcgL domain-containing protein [Gammaproteobacteria bacterium]|nr:YcgL domain-containing protein [Gammaproteobacteria bacterium]
MDCWIYKGTKRAETYVFLAKEDHFDIIPTPLRDAMGTLERVMHVDLAARKSLARASIEDVKEALNTQGFYLQMPPAEPEKAF